MDDLVTFTNVGSGKELTDTKIKGIPFVLSVSQRVNIVLMTMFASWRHCVRIVLGGSHDNGYSRTLSKLQTDNISAGKVALLQGPPFGGELARMSTALFPRVQFGDLFMSTKLDANAAKTISYVQVASSPGTIVSATPRRGSSPPKNCVVPYKSAIPEYGTHPLIHN